MEFGSPRRTEISIRYSSKPPTANPLAGPVGYNPIAIHGLPFLAVAPVD